jgi:hypothetical protein
MSCMLRAAGKYFDVDAFLEKNNLAVSAVFRRGKPKSINKSRIKYLQSSINIAVSNASFDNMKRQVKDAINFLTENRAEIKRLIRFKGVKGAELDFASNKNDKFLQEVEFPSELFALTSSLCLSIKLSIYAKPIKRKV